MFKTLTRTLKLGLTAITILTAGGFAGTAFAQSYANDRVGYCANNPTSTLCGSTSAARLDVASCIRDPFGTSCARTFTPKELIVAKTRYCGTGTNYDLPVCETTVARANAANWAKQNPDAPTSPDTTNQRSQFLKGGAVRLNTSGITIRDGRRHELYLDTSTFNNIPLGGDATDGVAFVTSVPFSYYAGILSGTDLGAPVIGISGTTASWVGRFQTVHFTTNKDFVLEVTFGDGNTGSIEAFVHRNIVSGITRHWPYFYLKGTFNDSGLITGTTNAGNYIDNDRTRPTLYKIPGVLTGLIGQNGAVGAFYSHSAHYYGGFVARPAEDVDGAQTFLDDTCNSTNPFATASKNQEFCRIEYAKDRVSIIDDCLEDDGSVKNSSKCTTAATDNSCINNPFADKCAEDPDFITLHVSTRANRIAFCNNRGSQANDPLCTPTYAVTAICNNNLFGVGCLTHSSYADARKSRLNLCSTDSGNSLCMGTNLINLCSYAPFSPLCVDNDDYASKRARIFRSCRSADSDSLSCNGSQKPSELKPDAANWEDSFVTLANPSGLSSITSVNLSKYQYRVNQFVEDLGLEEDFDSYHLRTRGKTPFTFLTLEDNLVGSTETLGGESEDGVAFFGLRETDYSYYARPFYAGILSGTDLGAPITGITGTVAIWSGVFQAISGKGSRRVKRNFDLTVTFTDSKTGEIDAFVNSTGDNYYKLTGNFDSIGVITGTVDYGHFTDGNSDNPTGDRLPGRLTGLIGEQGAVGAFIADMDGHRGFYSGGFVARETKVDYVDWAAEANPVDAIPTTLPTTRNHKFVSGERADEVSETEKLNLRTATYNGYLLNGDSTDGVAFFKRPSDSFPAVHYAGVLSGTDLGALIVQPNTRAHWSGSLQTVSTGGIQSAVDFVLTVAFTDNGGSISAEALNAAYSNNHPQTVHLDGTFNYKGVITGTSKMGRIDRNTGLGNLIGLIGQDGAVGTFISTAGVEYSGGFVARPHSVNIKDLRNYATLETTPSRGLNSGSEFLIAIPPNTELDDNRGHFPSGFSPISGSSTIGRRDGDTDDGYQYFGIEHDDQDSRYYAGILSTTNLGAPLVTPAKDAPITTAIWEGHVSFNTIAKEKSTEFYVNFSDGTIGFLNDARNGTGKATVVEQDDHSTGVKLTLNGKFGAGATDMNGTLSLGQLGGHMLVSTRPDTELFPVTGLIGQDGVVGVFVNPSATSGSAGGFVGQPKQ